MPMLPQHLAFIPDGNRRWAKNRSKPSIFGHRAGAKNFENLLDHAFARGVTYVTFWGCSIDNVTKRDPKEIAFLFQLFKLYFQKIIRSKKIKNNDVRVRVIGQWKKYFPDNVKKVIEEAMQTTKEHKRNHLTLLLAYNGNEEMLTAIKKLQRENDEITAETLKNSLYTKDLPPVDLLIRTGNDPHLSNGFMMWDTQNAELFFSDKMWPDFSSAELDKALDFYAGTGRRLGK